MKRWPIWLCLVLCVAMLAASGCAARSDEKAQRAVETVVVEAPMAEREMAAGAAQDEALPASATAADAGDERMIIQTVNMTIVVEDTDTTLDALRKMAGDYQGYISDSSRWLVNDQPYARVTLRIPAESLEEALGILRDSAVRVESENTSGQDVTEEYYDVDARLRNLEATEKELLALLTEIRENRSDAEEILAVHRELTNIRSQIESLKGRKQYLERMSALATVNLEIRPKAKPGTVVQKAKWNPLVTATNALRGFVRLLQVLADILIYVLIFSPFVLIPALILWLIVRWIRRRKKRAN